MHILAFYLGLIGVKFVGDIANNPDAFKGHPDVQASEQGAVPVDRQGISIMIFKANQVVNFDKDLSLLYPNDTQSVSVTNSTTSGLMTASGPSTTNSSERTTPNALVADNSTMNSSQAASNSNSTQGQFLPQATSTDGNAEGKPAEEGKQEASDATPQTNVTAADGESGTKSEEPNKDEESKGDNNTEAAPSSESTEKPVEPIESNTSQPNDQAKVDSDHIIATNTTETSQQEAAATNESPDNAAPAPEAESVPEVRRLSSKRVRPQRPQNQPKTNAELLSIMLLFSGYFAVLYLVWSKGLLALVIQALRKEDFDFSEQEPIVSGYTEMPTKTTRFALTT